MRVLATDVKAMCARFYGLSRGEMEGASRARRVARPRQVAMTLCRRYSGATLPSIGRRFHRDHTTVLHAIRAVDRLCAEDVSFFAELASLCGQIEAGAISCPKAPRAEAPVIQCDESASSQIVKPIVAPDEFLRRLAAERERSATPPQRDPGALRSILGRERVALPSIFIERGVTA